MYLVKGRAWIKTMMSINLLIQLMCIIDILRAPQVALVVKNQSANSGDARDVGSIPGLGRSPGVGNGNPIQYSCLENCTRRGPWWATVHGGRKELDMTEHIHQRCCRGVTSYLVVTQQ